MNKILPHFLDKLQQSLFKQTDERQKSFIGWLKLAKSIGQEELAFVTRGELGLGHTQDLENARNFTQMVNFIPKVDEMITRPYRHGFLEEHIDHHKRIDKVYLDIITKSDLNEIGLDAQDQMKLEALRNEITQKVKIEDIFTGEIKEITKPSKKYEIYEAYKLAYEKASTDFDNTRIELLHASNPDSVLLANEKLKTLRVKKNKALEAWVNKGYKVEIERIINYIHQLEKKKKAPEWEGFIAAFQKMYIQALADEEKFCLTSISPKGSIVENDWTSFAFTQDGMVESNFGEDPLDFDWNPNTSQGELEDEVWPSNKNEPIFPDWKVPDLHTEIEGDQSPFESASSALLSFRLDGKSTTQTKALEEDCIWESLTINAEAKAIRIHREWFNEQVFLSDYWKVSPEMKQKYSSELVSSGQFPPSGILPAIPTSMILLRNVEILFDTYSGNYDLWLNTLNSASVLSMGPFVLQKSGFQPIKLNGINKGFLFPQIQLLGFDCQVIPKAPK